MKNQHWTGGFIKESKPPTKKFALQICCEKGLMQLNQLYDIVLLQTFFLYFKKDIFCHFGYARCL